MTSSPGTLIELFSDLNGGSWAESMKVLEGGPVYARMMRRLAPLGGAMSNVEAFRTLSASIANLLRLDLGVILVGGWKKIAELRRYTDRDKYRPDETVIVELTRHAITSKHNPILDIVADGVKIDAVLFNLTLTITLDGALLEIRDGKILAVTPGSCKIGGELKCEGFEIFKRNSEAVKLDGRWAFEEPIQIPLAKRDVPGQR